MEEQPDCFLTVPCGGCRSRGEIRKVLSGGPRMEPTLDPLPTADPPEPETRGVRWIFGSLLLGLVLGALIGAFRQVQLFENLWATERPWLIGLLDGALAGALAGG